MIRYLLSIARFERSIMFFMISWSTIGLIHLGINTVLINLYMVELGFDYTYIGTMNGVGLLVWASLALPAGLISPRIGLRNSLAIGFALVAMSLVGFLSVIWLPADLWGTAFLVSNGLVWVGAALIAVNGSPYLMAVVPEEERSKAFTLQAALVTLAAFVGSLLAGIVPALLQQIFPGLNQADAYRAVLWAGPPTYLVSAALMRMARCEPPAVKVEETKQKEAAPLGLLAFVGIIFALQIGSENAVIMFANLYFASGLNMASSMIGSIFAAARILPFILSPLLPLAMNRWGSGKTMAAGSVFMGVWAAAILLLPNTWGGAASLILFFLSVHITATARALFGQESVLPRWRTLVNAVLTVSMAVGASLVGFLGGRVIDAAGFRPLFIGSFVLSLAAVMLYASRRWLGYGGIAKAAMPENQVQEAVAAEQA